MKLENQVCTALQGERLSELGVNAPSTFMHTLLKQRTGNKWFISMLVGDLNGIYVIGECCGIENPTFNIEQAIEKHPAYTVSELGVMLRSAHDTMRLEAEQSKWRGYDDFGRDYPTLNNLFDTEAKARAAMLISLIINGGITPEECNEALKNA